MKGWPRYSALLLGFALVMANVPWAYADYNVGRWAVAWLGIALLLWACPVQRIIWPGVAFLALAAASLLWAPVQLNANGAILHWGLLAGAFMVGMAGLSDEIFVGAGWGMLLNSALAVYQFVTWQPWMRPAPEGLFGNRDFLAETALLIMIPLLWKRRWVLAGLLAPAAFLPMYRGALLAAGVVGVAALWNASRMAAILVIVVCAVVVGWVSLSGAKRITADDRLGIWEDTIAGLTPLGRGAGQFYNTFPEHETHGDIARVRTDHAHNDWLEILYEFGPLGLGLAGIFAAGCLVAGFTARVGGQGAAYTFLAFCVLGCVGFPAHNAASAVLGLLAAGGVYAGRGERGISVAGEPVYA